MYSVKKIKKPDDWQVYREMILEVPYTSFTLLPEWLEGYCLIPGLIRKIGYFIINDQGDIIGGIAGIRYWLGEWIAVFPSDPIMKEEGEINNIDLIKILKAILDATKGKIHISSGIDNPELLGLKKCRFPRGFYPNPGIGEVQLYDNIDEQFSNLKYSLKRKIKDGLKSEIEIEEINSVKQFINFYKSLKMNSIQGKYNIRPYFSLKRIWVKGLINDTLKLVIIKYENTIVASGFFLKSGSCLHYIMGSSNKDIKKLNSGYLMHWIGIKMAIQFKFIAYNISIGGPKNIEKIKEDFGRSQIKLKTTYIWKIK
jgi:hypothetical protein